MKLHQKETFVQKEKRVTKQLRKILDKGQLIQSLNEEQKYIILVLYGSSVCKYFKFPIGYGSAWEAENTPIDLETGFHGALTKAIDYVTSNKLLNPSYSMDVNDYCNRIMVVGYRPVTEATLIKYFTDDYNARNDYEEDLKNLKKLSETKKSKSLTISGVKYKLTKV